jgi:hypothetical protein
MRLIRISLFLLLLSALSTGIAGAQVAPTAFKSPLSLTVGGMVSGFQPDYVNYKLGGVGTYIDLNIFHGIGIEAEGRWQRFHELDGISQDNYLVGPRVKVLHIWRAQPYVKALGGFSEMNFGTFSGNETGRFTTFAFGGGVDLKLSRRWSVRPIDAEYQIWPYFGNSTLSPYGLSAGIGYRIF